MKIENKLRETGWIVGQVRPGPADNQIHDVRDPGTPTIGKEFEKYGITWARSDKSRGSRKIGLEVMRQMVENAKTGESAALYVMHNCRAALKLLPTIPRDEDDPDDVDTQSPDHIYDDTRYRVLSTAFRPGVLTIK